jgi:hypothetical protein
MSKLGKIFGLVAVATVMGAASPTNAQSGEPLYYRYYSENGQLVGRSKDLCTSNGIHTEWMWGRVTSDVDLLQFGICVDGQVYTFD